MDHTNAEAQRAQVRKHLKVRAVPPRHLLAKLEISLRLLGSDGAELLTPVTSSVSLSRPLDPLVRELNLAQAQGSLTAAVTTFLRGYDELLQPVAKATRPAADRNVVTAAPLPGREVPTEVVDMFNLSKTKAKPDEDSLQSDKE